MDKTHNISLGGFAFSIEDSAYHILQKYLQEIRVSINNITDADEIVSDVEFRMAELLRERLLGREVVNSLDVHYLIKVMGEPQDFYTEDIAEEADTSYKKTNANDSHFSSKSKKLFRDPDNKFIGGVCSGLGHYIGMDATWVRLLTVASMFIDPIFFSMGSMIFVGYFILWLVVPEAKTTSDKLQMRGEPVNVDSIRDFFGKSPENIKNNLKDVHQDARRVASHSGSIIGNLFRILFKIIGVCLLILLIIIALALLVSFVALILGVGSAFFGAGIATFSLDEYLPYILENGWEKVFLYISLFLVLVIPAVALILLTLRIISKRYAVPRYVGFGLPLLWLVGLIGLTIITGLTLRNFTQTSTEIKTVNIPTNAKTLLLQVDQDNLYFNSKDLLDIQPGYLTFPNTDNITVRKSKTGINYLELKYSAKGKNRAAAAQALEPISFNYSVEDSLVSISPYVAIKKGSQWRSQKVEPILYLTDSTKVVFRNFEDGEAIINGNRDWFDTDPENIYIFEDESFKCINCNTIEEVQLKEDSLSIEDVEPESINIQANKDSINIKIK